MEKDKIFKLIKKFKGKKVRISLEIETTDLNMDIKELVKSKFDRLAIISEINNKVIDNMTLNCSFTQNELEEIFWFCDKCKLELVLAKDPNFNAEITGVNETTTVIFTYLQPLLQEMKSKNLEEILKSVAGIVNNKDSQPDEKFKLKFMKPMIGSNKVQDFIIPTKEELIQNITEIVLENSNEDIIFTQNFKHPLTEEEIALLQMTCTKIDLPSTFSYTFQEDSEH